MKQDVYIKVADQISDKLIAYYKNKKGNEQTILEIFNDLLEEKYKTYQHEILSYIPERLAMKGYEIVNSNHFELKEY